MSKRSQLIIKGSIGFMKVPNTKRSITLKTIQIFLAMEGVQPHYMRMRKKCTKTVGASRIERIPKVSLN